MLVQGTILNVNFQEFEGTILLRWGDVTLRVCYNTPEKHAKEFLHVGKTIFIDLWLLYGSCKKIEENIRDFPIDNQICGGRIRGQVCEVLSQYELRLDCGFLIDVVNEQPLQEIASRDFIETIGTFHVYFPRTEWER